MPGVTGADVNAAYALSNTWAVPASVTQKVLLTSTDGLDGGPAIVDDDSFNQSFIGEGEAGDYPALTPELAQLLRYEGPATNWMAMAMGSPAAPVAVSSQGAANSLVAYQHVVALAPSITKFLTLAVDEKQQVLEVPTLKVRGFSLKVGDNGRMSISFPVVGNKPVYNSTTNTNSTVGGAAVAPMAHRVYRSQGVFRLNLQAAGTLGTADAVQVRDLSTGVSVPLTTDDYVTGSDGIIEPDVDGFAELPVELTFPRMNTVSANSLARALAIGGIFKADLTFTGAYINSATPRSIKLEWPALQITGYRAPVTGHNQVRPVGTFKAKMATNTPSGFTFVNPVRLTITNASSSTLC